MKYFIFLALLSMPFLSVAHSGRTNSQGCHNDNIHGGYHCHSGSSSTSNEVYDAPNTIDTHNYSQPSKPAKRDNKRIRRSSSAIAAFKRLHPCPANGKTSGKCRGYIIDHITPLACGGADDPSNMQWQTKNEAKAKDKWERDNCEARN